ncbi:MAG TPA: glycosyltransferase family 4 protein [Candidatus Paceibacterota bacterium]|nr:glycosyltransferase family 4 protein [Candidatus Paceibacterota bacterium]
MSRRDRGLQGRAFHATRSFLRRLSSERTERVVKTGPQSHIKVAFIHNEKRLHADMHTGAAQINRLMARALADRGVQIKHFYPTTQLTDTPVHLKGIANILFFYSLLEHKEQILRYDIIQGTTYTPLPFLTFSAPVICHFGSTAKGFLDSVPSTRLLPRHEKTIFKELAELSVIPELDLKTLRPMEDVADIEALTASQATACIATSEKVRDELMEMGVLPERIRVIHNAIEDYWFERQRHEPDPSHPPHLVFLGRLGNDVFTLKLKGLSRLINFYRAFPDIPKTTVCMTSNQKLKNWLRVAFPKHYMFVNLRKDLIPGALAPLYGSILFLSSRYEGFSLSLVEGMSQGLVPISFPVGVAPEVIKDGVNGYIVSSEREAEEKARELLANPDRRNAMATAAQETANDFRSTKIAQELLALYSSVKQEERRRRKGA